MAHVDEERIRLERLWPSHTVDNRVLDIYIHVRYRRKQRIQIDTISKHQKSKGFHFMEGDWIFRETENMRDP